MSSNDSVRELLNRANRLLANGDTAGARVLAQQAYALDKTNPDVLILISKVIADPLKQRNVLNQVLRIDPTHREARQHLAELNKPPIPNPLEVPVLPPTHPMKATSQRVIPRRLLLAMVGGVGALILVALVSLLNRPAATPEGVVLRFWQALQANDDNGVLDTLGDRPRDQNASLLVGCGGAVRCLKPETPANPQGVSATISVQRDTSARVMLRVQGTYKDVQGAYCADIGVNKINGEWKIVDLSGTFVLCPSQAAIAQQATAYPPSMVATTTPNAATQTQHAIAATRREEMMQGATRMAQQRDPYWTQPPLGNDPDRQASQIAATATPNMTATLLQNTAQVISLTDQALATYRAQIMSTQMAASPTYLARGLTATSARLTQTAIPLTQTETALMRLPGRIVVSTNGFKYQSVALNTLQSTAIPALAGRYSLQFSPDGKQVVEGHAFEANFIAEADGSQSRPIDTGLTDPAWSPNGKRLVVGQTAWSTARLDWQDKLYIALSTDFSQRTEVMNVASKSSISGYQFAWSPDGQQIAYIQTKDKRLYTIQPDGTHGKLLFVDYPTVTNLEMGWPAWSPDSQQIAFWLYKSNVDSGVYLMNADGTQVRRVTPLTVVCSGPAWSPDGHYLSVSCALPGQYNNRQVFITPIDGAWQIQVGKLDGVGDWTRWVN